MEAAPTLSVTVNSNRYTPCIKLLIAVLTETGELIIPGSGPDIFTQLKDTTVPSSSSPLPMRFNVLVGNVIIASLPAFATGGKFCAAFTVTRIVSDATAPLLSTTVNTNWYTPWTRLLTMVLAALVVTILPVDGPVIFVQE